MKKGIWLLMLWILPSAVPAIENSMPNLETPSELTPGQMKFQVQHRFYGKINDRPGETFFGVFGQGANTGLGLSAALGKRFGASGIFISEGKEYQFGLSYGFSINRWIQTQAELRYFSFRPTIDSRESNLFFLWVLQGVFLKEKVIPAVNIGYDGFRESFGCGFGLSLELSEKYGIMAEFFPDVDSNETGAENGFTLGAKIKTAGHRFLFVLGNSFQIGTRRLMPGAPDNHLHLGFTIQRLLEW